MGMLAPDQIQLQLQQQQQQQQQEFNKRLGLWTTMRC